MSDRELLEMAVKAAGYEMRETSMSQYPAMYRIGEFHPWNPLTDDGDALRLANKLDISINHDEPICVQVFVFQGYSDGEYEQGCQAWKVNKKDASVIEIEQVYGTDKDAATRRAIVRAAAEIGKAMP